MSLAIGGLWLLLLGAPRLAQPSPFWSPTAPLPRPYAQLLVASPADDRNLYAVAGDASQVSALFESVDGGASWTELAPLPAEADRIARHRPVGAVAPASQHGSQRHGRDRR